MSRNTLQCPHLTILFFYSKPAIITTQYYLLILILSFLCKYQSAVLPLHTVTRTQSNTHTHTHMCVHPTNIYTNTFMDTRIPQIHTYNAHIHVPTQRHTYIHRHIRPHRFQSRLYQFLSVNLGNPVDLSFFYFYICKKKSVNICFAHIAFPEQPLHSVKNSFHWCFLWWLPSTKGLRRE